MRSVARAGRGFRMELEAEEGKLLVPHSLNGAVVRVHEESGGLL
jgi:hypothetical protein